MIRNAREEFVADEYNTLAELAGFSSVDTLIGRIEEILTIAGLGTPFGRLGVREDSIGMMAREAAAQWTASFNPVEYTTSDFEEIYREVL